MIANGDHGYFYFIVQGIRIRTIKEGTI